MALLRDFILSLVLTFTLSGTELGQRWRHLDFEAPGLRVLFCGTCEDLASRVDMGIFWRAGLGPQICQRTWVTPEMGAYW